MPIGLAQPAVNPIPPTMWSYHEGTEGYAYDPELAKALLAEAGQSDLKLDGRIANAVKLEGAELALSGRLSDAAWLTIWP